MDCGTCLFLKRQVHPDVSLIECGELSASTRHHFPPLLGYDWIAGIVLVSLSLSLWLFNPKINHCLMKHVISVPCKESWKLRTLWLNALMSSSMTYTHSVHTTKKSVSTAQGWSECLDLIIGQAFLWLMRINLSFVSQIFWKPFRPVYGQSGGRPTG